MLVELPLPIEPEELGDVVLLDEPVLGDVVLGDVVLGDVLDEPLLEELPLMPELVPPLEELDPDLLKYASHSVREIEPSLLVSTDEKLGVEALPEAELGEVVLEDEPPAAPVDELPLVADGVEDDPLLDLSESAAPAARDRAKSAAAVVTVTVLIIEHSFVGWGSPPLPASPVPPRPPCG